jgi:hypothetical protein
MRSVIGQVYSWTMEALPMCPSCGSTEVVPIAYGLPGPELMERAERGEVALGGCLVSGNDPRWQCRSCGLHFPQQR